jgi:hypothetical protein
MKARNKFLSSAILITALAAGGCAQDGAALTTSAVAPEKAAGQAVAKADPACVALSAQIDALRKDGTVESLEKAATGKSKSVEVKRSALAKQAELNKANTDFQAKCAPAIPKAQSAQVAAPAAAHAVASQADAAKKASSGSTAAASPASPSAAAKDAATTAAKDAAKDATKPAP